MVREEIAWEPILRTEIRWMLRHRPKTGRSFRCSAGARTCSLYVAR